MKASHFFRACVRSAPMIATALVILAGLATPALAKRAVHCGNGFVDQQFSEQCDGSNLNGQTCASIGFGGGTLSCTSSCQFDTSGCFTCGNGTIEDGEQCDGSNLNGAGCSTEGFAGGTLACNSNCTFNTGGCTADTCSADLATCNSNLASCQSATCGNGVAEFGEDCDGQNLQGQTCQTRGFTYGKLACSGGCAFDTSKCTNSRFVDNSDGTITDNETGLMWEKKSDDGTVHDKDNTYTWSNTGAEADGTAYTSFLEALNAQPAQVCTSGDGSSVTCTGSGCFAGHCDWRLPQIDELGTILKTSCTTVPPCIVDPIFNSGCSADCTVTTCSCTKSSGYWSATTASNNNGSAWDADFVGGVVFNGSKVFNLSVRAVRGGSSN